MREERGQFNNNKAVFHWQNGNTTKKFGARVGVDAIIPSVFH
jgi:hypothetical protein